MVSTLGISVRGRNARSTRSMDRMGEGTGGCPLRPLSCDEEGAQLAVAPVAMQFLAAAVMPLVGAGNGQIGARILPLCRRG